MFVSQSRYYTEEEREELWIQKQEEGYKFIMGEKHKVEKKSVKHWIVTEKGHTNTRRIRIHGIFWHPNKAGLSYLLKKCWIAGYSYQGKYVNDKTVNYIVKKK